MAVKTSMHQGFKPAATRVSATAAPCQLPVGGAADGRALQTLSAQQPLWQIAPLPPIVVHRTQVAAGFNRGDTLVPLLRPAQVGTKEVDT